MCSLSTEIKLWALVIVLACTTACSQLPSNIAFSDPVSGAFLQEAYVVSGRLPSTTPIEVEQDRTGALQFVEYQVSIPATHQLGQIEWPDGAVDPATDFAVISETMLQNSATFIAEIAATPGNEVTLYVHGYNTTPSEALYRLAQIKQDFQIDTPHILFSWPSAGQATGYVYDRDSVLFSRDPLADLMTDIARKTDKKIILLGHSLGAHLTMEVLRQLAITERRDVLQALRVVVLVAPDIDPDIFRAQANAVGTLPDPFVIMTNRDDRALNFSKFLNFGRQKVGDLSRAEDVAGLNVTIFDFTALADGSNFDHLVPLASPPAISVLRDLVNSNRRGQLDLSQFDVTADGVIRAKPQAVN